MCLSNEGALFCDLFRLSGFLHRRLRRLFLYDLLGHQVASDGVAGEVWVDLNLLMFTKHWLVDRLEQEFDLWIAEAHHGRTE